MTNGARDKLPDLGSGSLAAQMFANPPSCRDVAASRSRESASCLGVRILATSSADFQNFTIRALAAVRLSGTLRSLARPHDQGRSTGGREPWRRTVHDE